MQHHNGCGGNRLGHGGNAEDAVGRNTNRRAIKHLITVGDNCHDIRQIAPRHRILQQAIQFDGGTGGELG
jgi:hypothetical protein